MTIEYTNTQAVEVSIVFRVMKMTHLASKRFIFADYCQ